MGTYEPPRAQAGAFNCAHCGAYSHQKWYAVHGRSLNGQTVEISGFAANRCTHCNGWGMWTGQVIIYPAVTASPLAHADMPSAVAEDYEEARQVARISPRAAAALLRLALQKLCIALGQKGENLNSDIGNLAKQGLDANIVKALDILRITGNNAVHPGELDLRDDLETVGRLFRLLNVIVEQLITQPRVIEELYNQLPSGAREGVERRDTLKK